MQPPSLRRFRRSFSRVNKEILSAWISELPEYSDHLVTLSSSQSFVRLGSFDPEVNTLPSPRQGGWRSLGDMPSSCGAQPPSRVAGTVAETC